MSGNNTPENPVFKGFNFLGKTKLEASSFYAKSMIELIITGIIGEDDPFPSVKYIAEHNKITYHYARVAYGMIVKEGYMERSVGRLSLAKNPKSLLPPTELDLKIIHANFPVKHVILNTVELDAAFKRYRNKNSNLNTPVDENTTSPSLIRFLVKRYNREHNQNLSFARLYYSHDLQHLLTAVFEVLHEQGSVMVIPAQIDVVFKHVLQALHMEFVEVGMDHEGLLLEDLITASENHKVSTIIIISKACGLRLTDTTAARLNDIYALKKKVGCKIVELDLCSTWAKNVGNLLIDNAGEAIEDLVYISPLTRMTKEMASLTYVAAKEEIISLIKNRLKANGERAVKSVADATVKVLTEKKFLHIETKIAEAIAIKTGEVLKVFGSDFWEIIGLQAKSGLRFGLKPVYMQFPPDTYRKLLERKIEIYDPVSYDGAAEDGILLDLSQYIGQMKFTKTLRLIEKACREVCVEKENGE